MTDVRFRQCANCNTLRSWNKEVCPQCGDDSSNKVTQNGAELINQTTGGTLSESTLFASEVSLRDVLNSRISNTYSQRLFSSIRSLATLASQFQKVHLEYRLCDYLEPDEQPEFLIFFMSPLREDDGTEIRKIESSSQTISSAFAPMNGGLLLVTDSRMLILVEQDQHTVNRSMKYADIEDISENQVLDESTVDRVINKITNQTIFIQGNTRSYQLLACSPIKEVSPIVAYVSAQIGGEEFDAESAYADSETVGDRVNSIVDRIDFKRVLSYAVTGGKFGSRGGQYGTVGGAVIGAAYGIYSSITGQSPKDAGEPNGDNIGAAAAEWRQAGADMEDKRAEWLGASLGVALQIAAEGSDRDAINSIQHVDPQTTTQVIQRGLEAVDSRSNLPATPQEFESSLPESIQTWQSVAADLLEEGLLDELQAAHEEYTYEESV